MTVRFAWLPVRVHRVSYAYGKKIGHWVSDGWLWLGHYQVIRNIYGEVFRKRISTEC